MVAMALGWAVLASGQDGLPADPLGDEASPGDPPAEDAGPDRSDEWAPLTLLRVVEPERHGAVGDGAADDTQALQATFDALSEQGGIVWLAPDRVYRTTDVIRITGDHVKVWAPDGQAEIMADGGDEPGRQALIVDGATGTGIFGPVIRSDADERRTTLEDSAVVVDGALDTELVGLEIVRSSSAAVFVYGQSRRTWIEGNEITDNWADAIHFTDGSREAWAWGNVIVSREPTLGDDGIACVTYGSGPRCGEMEWWANTHLGNGWGRGLAVVGGDNIAIHDNVILDTAAAGIIVASEPSYRTPGSDHITIERNVISGTGHAVAHPGILISALHGPIDEVVIADNSVVAGPGQSPVRSEGDVGSLSERGTSPTASAGALTSGPLAGGDRAARRTSILATRDPSLAPSEQRRGLHRVHVRGRPETGFEQRLEYVVAGAPSAIDAWQGDRGGEVVRFRSWSADEDVVVIRTGVPLSLPAFLRPIGFEELRAGTADLPELWAYLDAL